MKRTEKAGDTDVQPACGIWEGDPDVFHCGVPPMPPKTSMGFVVRFASRPISGTRTGSMELMIVSLGYTASCVWHDRYGELLAGALIPFHYAVSSLACVCSKYQISTN